MKIGRTFDVQQIGPGAQPTRFAKLRASFWLSAVWSVLVPTVFFVTMEWIHRGTLGGDFWIGDFANALCADCRQPAFERLRFR